MGKLISAARSLGLRYAVVLLYILAGGAIFVAIENRGLEDEIERIGAEIMQIASKKELLRKQLSAQLNVSVNVSLFENFTSAILELSSKTKPNKWDMSTGGHFAFTIVSTIGYGVIVPTSDSTRVMTIFYAIFGIPLFLYAMAAAGELKKELCDSILQLIETKLLKTHSIRYKHAKVLVMTLVFLMIELLAASAAVYQEEDWSFFIALYFWFITASTIGFGDYVLSFNGNNQVTSGMMVAVILVTLILMSDLGCCFSTISELLEERSKTAVKNKCSCLGLGTERSENSVEEPPQEMTKVERGTGFQNNGTNF